MIQTLEPLVSYTLDGGDFIPVPEPAFREKAFPPVPILASLVPRLYCNKQAYDLKGARTAINHRKHVGAHQTLRAYECPYCNAWHLTHKEVRE